MKPRFTMPHSVTDFARAFRENGAQCWLVGGAVRNLLMGTEPGDFDFATDAPPERVMAMFRNVIPTGIKHGTVTVLRGGESFEVTTFRVDGEYDDGRHPDSVTFARDIDEDLSRRDFTMNGIALDPLSGEIRDPFDGRKDIERRIIRAIGDPARRFDEDGLRPLRAIRFACVLGFEIDPATLEAIPQALGKTALVSSERLRDEFVKMMMSPRPDAAIRLLESTGILRLVLPELASCRGVSQKGMHRFDVLDHLIESVRFAPAEKTVRLAALFHDIGKPETKKTDDDGVASFHRHEQAGAAMAERVMRRLKFPNKDIEAVSHLILHHMFFYEDVWSDAAVRRFIARVGESSLDNLLWLRYADASGMTGVPAPLEPLEMFRHRLMSVIAEGKAFGLKDLSVNGDDLIRLGCERGKRIGVILGELLEAVLEDPACNERERLIVIAERLLGK